MFATDTRKAQLAQQRPLVSHSSVIRRAAAEALVEALGRAASKGCDESE